MFLTPKGRARVQEILSAMTGKPVTDFETKDSQQFSIDQLSLIRGISSG
jgi:hypothetical protein